MTLRKIAVPFGPYAKGDQVQLSPEDEKRLGAHLEPLAPAPAADKPAPEPAPAEAPEADAAGEEPKLPPQDKKAPKGKKK